jgi:hypothetical protein
MKQQAYEVIGINPQRMGQQLSQQTATGVEQAVGASYAQTEMYFMQHSDYLMPRVHQMRTDLAQFYHSTKPSARLTYVTAADEKVNFQINGTDLLMRDLNIFATTKANYRAVLEQLKGMALNNNTTGASIYDLGKLVQSESIAELNTVLKDSEAKIKAQKDQEMQHQQQMQEQALQAKAQEEKLKADSADMRAEKDRQRDILVAEIRAAGFGATQDINQNQMSDFTDTMRDIQKTDQFTSQMSLERQKESNRMSADGQKNQLEREKLQVQQSIADKQLQIARENKNKFDTKSKTDNKKK